MRTLTLNEIRTATGGRALASMTPAMPMVSAVCSDTRQLSPGCLFVAIKGERFNAHDFLPQAASKGAIAALVEELPSQVLPNVQLIQVQNTRTAMGKLARYVRSKMLGKVITVSGSNGKTSTKFMIDSALRGSKLGTMSPKSFNNDIGVPMSIFAADPGHDYLVLEIGTNHPGEIRTLTHIAQPDIAVLTNVGCEHLEGLGDLAGVRSEEASIIEGLNPRGLLVVNGDDDDLLEAVKGYQGQRVTFGLKETNDLFASDIRFDQTGTRYFLNGSRREVFIPLLGKHNACNSLAAIAVARRLRLSEEKVIEALAHATGPEMRLQIQAIDGITFLNDTYNANPSSVSVALETLVGLKTKKRRIAILGEMRELGESSDHYHREMGELAGKLDIDLLVFVGKSAEIMRDGAIAAGMGKRQILLYPSAAAAAADATETLRTGDLVLVKASRSIGLEAVVREVEAQSARVFRKAAS